MDALHTHTVHIFSANLFDIFTIGIKLNEGISWSWCGCDAEAYDWNIQMNKSQLWCWLSIYIWAVIICLACAAQTTWNPYRFFCVGGMHYIASNACWCNLMHAKIIKCVVGKFQNHQTRNSLFFGSIWKCWFFGFVCIVMHSCHTACSTKTFSILPHLHWHILLDGKSSSEWTKEGKR